MASARLKLNKPMIVRNCVMAFPRLNVIDLANLSQD
jgi:hypothetical protein